MDELDKDEAELQEALGKGAGERNKYGALLPPLPHEVDRLRLIPCSKHGQDLTCDCTDLLDVELDIYHIAVLYPGMLHQAFEEYFANHQGEFKEAFEKEGIGL